jgi:hypothetical protein
VSPRLKIRLKALDFLVLGLGAAAIAFSAAFVYGSRGAESEVVITGKTMELVYPLKTDRSVEVPGPLGTTLVRIEGGRVRIEDSPCPNKTCIAAGAIGQPGQWVACLPNAVLVRVEGASKEAGVDVGTW